MGKTLKDRHDNDTYFTDFDDDIDGIESRLPPLQVVKSKPPTKTPTRKRRPEMWEDDWTDPEDDLFRGFKDDMP